MVLLFGCKTTERFERSAAGLASAEPLPVTLSNEIRTLREKERAFVGESTFRIGQALQKHFFAEDGVAFLSAVSSDLETHWTAPTGWTSTYYLSLVLQHEGSVHSVSATGSGSSSNPERAGRRAIEDCIVEIYAQVQAILKKEPGPSSQVSAAE